MIRCLQKCINFRDYNSIVFTVHKIPLFAVANNTLAIRKTNQTMPTIKKIGFALHDIEYCSKGL